MKSAAEKLREAVLGRSIRSEGDGMVDESALGSSLLSEGERFEDEEEEQARRQNQVRPSSRRHSEDALAAQLRSNEAFEENLRKEEEQIYSEIRARKILEEEDRKLAERLQEEWEGGAAPLRIQVKVPDGIRGGSFISVQIPGKSGFERVQIPPGLGAGDEFTYISSGALTENNLASNSSIVRIRIPENVRPGQPFPHVLPNGARISVVAPPNSRPGEQVMITVDSSVLDQTPQASQVSQLPSGSRGDTRPRQAPLSDAERREREAFLAALPEDIRAEILAQEQQEQGGYSDASPRQSQQASQGGGRDDWVSMVQVAVPQGLRAGQQFRTVMPNGRAVMVTVPPGIEPGDVIGIPLEEEQQPAPAPAPPAAAPAPTISLPDEERESFLAALPPDIREEVLAAERASSAPSAQFAPPGAAVPTEEVVDLLGSTTPQVEEESVLQPADEPSLLDFDSPVQDEEPMVDWTAPTEVEEAKKASGFSFMATPVPAPSEPAPVHSSLAPSTVQTPSPPPPAQVAQVEKGTQQARQAPDGDAFASLSQATAATMVPPNPGSETPPLQRLKEAKAQLDRGEITQEEFNAIKKQVIASI